MVKCDKGVYKTRTIHRIPKEERWDRAAIEEVRFTPWMIKERTAKDELNGCQEQEHKASVDIEINKDIEVELKLPPRHVDPNTDGSTSRRLWSRNLVEPMGVRLHNTLGNAVTVATEEQAPLAQQPVNEQNGAGDGAFQDVA